ncbi:MAG: hypothetical protein BAJALOKI1v1_390005 [Promethearchaeota archaeon]|nr:MAG: hypothetical protein BAJALOKI1v1_390005 [Candidatus Lokiarchaeota archaeon]
MDTLAIAWTSLGQDGSGNGIYARVFDATTGANMMAEFRVNEYINNGQMATSICAISEDSFAVAWESNGQDGSGYNINAKVLSVQASSTTPNSFFFLPPVSPEGISGYGILFLLSSLGTSIILFMRKLKKHSP